MNNDNNNTEYWCATFTEVCKDCLEPSFGVIGSKLHTTEKEAWAAILEDAENMNRSGHGRLVADERHFRAVFEPDDPLDSVWLWEVQRVRA